MKRNYFLKQDNVQIANSDVDSEKDSPNTGRKLTPNDWITADKSIKIEKNVDPNSGFKKFQPTL